MIGKVSRKVGKIHDLCADFSLNSVTADLFTLCSESLVSVCFRHAAAYWYSKTCVRSPQPHHFKLLSVLSAVVGCSVKAATPALRQEAAFDTSAAALVWHIAGCSPITITLLSADVFQEWFIDACFNFCLWSSLSFMYTMYFIFYCIIVFLDYCKAPSCAKRSILQFKNMFLNGHTAALSSSTSKRKVIFVKLVCKSVMFCDFIWSKFFAHKLLFRKFFCPSRVGLVAFISVQEKNETVAG